MSTSSSKSSSHPASTMAELMANYSSKFTPLTKGQVVKGILTKVTPLEITMQLASGKTDAVVMEKDRRLHKQLLEMIHEGDEVEATVLSVESEFGYPLVSLRHFLEGKTWKHLQELKKSGEKLPITVVEITKGGLVVETPNGISGFLPNSHMKSQEDMQVGKKMQASIAEVSQENKKVIFSQKDTITEEDFKKISGQYKTGQRVKGVVSGITSFGIFVSLPFSDKQERLVDGLVHISEVAWEKVEDLSERFTMGEEVEAVVIGVDPRSKRIDLSIKRLTDDPFSAITKQFEVDKKVRGEVKEITDLGVVVDLGMIGEAAVEGLIKKDKIPAATTYEIGQTVTTTVTGTDNKKRKVLLTPVLLEKPLMYR